MKPYKKLIFNLSILSFVLIISSFSCRKENSDVLPPETQTGANTFGCLVDGQLFLGYTTTFYSSFKAIYDPVADELSIGSYGNRNKDMGYIGMTINHPIQNEEQKNVSIEYTPITGSSCTQYQNSTSGEVYITKFDTTNKIISGTFQFTGYCVNDSTSTKQITQGRFDLKLYIYIFN